VPVLCVLFVYFFIEGCGGELLLLLSAYVVHPVGDENGFQRFSPFPLTKSLCQSGVKKHSISA